PPTRPTGSAPRSSVSAARSTSAGSAWRSASSAAASAAPTCRRPETTWGTHEVARVALVLATWNGEPGAFAARVDRLCGTGELSEHVACLKGFAVFPAPELLHTRAREAMRSSVQPV